MAGIFTCAFRCAATTTISGARNAFCRSRCSDSAPECAWVRARCAASSSPKPRRARPRARRTKRHGRRRPWSGARTALANISSRAAASGAGSVRVRAERRAEQRVYGLHAGIVADSCHAGASPKPASATRTRSSRCCARSSRRPARCSRSAAAPASTRVHFAAHLPQLVWQPSEVAGAARAARRAHQARRPAPTCAAPLALDVRAHALAGARGRRGVQRQYAAHHVVGGGRQLLPRRRRGAGAREACCASTARSAIGGRYTSASNARVRRVAAGARPGERHARFRGARRAGARPGAASSRADHAMPANNRTLLWRRAANAARTFA